MLNIDKWIALKIYPMVARMNARAFARTIKDENKLVQAVYKKDIDKYRKYDIKPNDIKQVIK
jgi:hypothetical protein